MGMLNFLRRRVPVLIVDPSLMDEAGHHLNVSEALSVTLANAGFETSTLAHRAFPADAHESLAATPLFLNRIYDGIWHVHEKPSRYEAITRKSSVELRHVLRGRRERLVIFPTVAGLEFPGMAEWICDHPNPETLEVYFWIVFGPEFMAPDPASEDRQAEWYAEGFAALEAAAETGAKLRPIVETQGLKDIWQPFTELEISVIRLPTMVHHIAREIAAQPRKGPLTIRYGGDVRDGKGFSLLPEIVTATLAEHPEVHFDLRVAVEDPSRHEADLHSLEENQAVTLKIGALPPRAFQRFLSTGDIILLPYDPEIYLRRGSSICDEAEALGKPQVLPSAVSFAQKMLAAGAATGFETYSAESIADALSSAIAGYDKLAARARSQQTTVTDQNMAFLELMRQTAKG